MEYDTKMISTEYKNGYQPGTIFAWRNTGTFWICYAQDITELAYFRGECRKCDYKVHWVDKDKQVRETLISVIGPTPPAITSNSSMTAAFTEDMPNNQLKVLTSDTEQNMAYFEKYQNFYLKRVRY